MITKLVSETQFTFIFLTDQKLFLTGPIGLLFLVCYFLKIKMMIAIKSFYSKFDAQFEYGIRYPKQILKDQKHSE
jgi:hypothetical protein